SAGTLGTLLNKLFQRSFAVAKEVRSNTGIGANVVSMAAAAVKLAGRIFPSLAEQKVLLVGAGEMIELAATHFAAQRPRGMAVASRTLDRAEALARRFNAESIELRDLPERLPEYDIIISCTASSLPIIGKGTMERTVRARRHRPVFMVDLAVPRDIEAEVAAMDDVFLYTIDDLAATVREGIDARQSAVAQAEAIIESQVGSFLHWMKTREMVPLIRQLRESAEEARLREVERAARMLARGDRPKAVLEPVVELFNKYRDAEQDVAEAQELLADPEMRNYAESEIKTGRERLVALESELQKLLLPRDPNDERNIFLEIRAGTGGDESALFAGDLFRMYSRYSERQGWQVEVISESPGDAGGYKEIIARVIGQGAYSKLKFESGGHRVQRVPATETHGRIHTSACTVAVLPEASAI